MCDNRSASSSASQEPTWPFGQTSKTLKKKDDQEKQREKVGDVLNFTRVRAIRAFALKDGHVLVYVNKPFYHQTAMPVSSTANSVL